jgi:hypothetical protein
MENTEQVNENVEVVEKVQPTICPTHNERLKICSKDNKIICPKCILFNKEEIAYYKENFEFITYFVPDDIKLYDYEGFDVINKVMKEYVEKVNDLVEANYENINISKDIITHRIKTILIELYLDTVTKFESTVKSVNSHMDKLDINDQQSKENFKQIKKSLDDQSEYLDNYEAISASFSKIVTGAVKKFERLKVSEVASSKNEFKVGKRGECLDFTGCNGPVVETSTGRGGTYWSVKSEEVLTGEFKAKIKVHNIDSSKVSGNFSYAVGICRKNSTNIDNYFNDCVLLQANGYLANKFTGTGTHKKLFKNNWKNGDEIIISRDKVNSVYFAINDEKETLLAFENISGDFRIVMGFNSNNSGDKFELIELN